MLAAPIGNDGVRQLIVVVEATLQFTPPAEAPPLLKSTAAPGSKLVPVRVSAIPPASGPEAGEGELIVGAAKVGGVCPAARKATTCITQRPSPRVAVAS